MGLFSKIGGVLFGKKQIQEADPIAKDLYENQATAVGIQRNSLGNLLKESQVDPTDQARFEQGREEAGLIGQRDDARRLMEQQVAAQGLRGTSAGLGQILGVDRSVANAINTSRASLPSRISNMRMDRANSLLGSATNFNQAQNLPNALRRTHGRVGGLAPVIGAGIGGLLGASSGKGLEGAQFGQGIGSSIGGAF